MGEEEEVGEEEEEGEEGEEGDFILIIFIIK